MQYKLVLFDLDGTLLNTLEAISKTINEAMKEMGLKSYSVQQYQQLIGHGIKGIVDGIFQWEKYSENNLSKAKMFEIIKKFYNMYFDYNVSLYEDIDKLLDFLNENEIKMGIITNKEHSLALKTVEKKLNKWDFVEIIGANDMEYPRKPSPYNVNKLCEKFGIEKNKVLFVGDMLVDVETAKNANVNIAYCNWGFGKLKNEKVDSNICVDSVEELIRWF